MQTILGAGGAIGTELAKALRSYTNKIRLVSRHPRPLFPDQELVSADLTNRDQVFEAVKGSEIAYLTIGFPYKYKIWKQSWPQVMEHVIGACKTYGVKLVFFDNIYMYASESMGRITEKAPIRPPSKKGEVRAQIADRILEEVASGNLEAMIVRSADFYGPNIERNCLLNEMVINKLSAGKKANWLGNPHLPHSFTYVPDAGRAMALLGNTDSAYGQIWHLPTAASPPTGHEWIERIASELDVSPHYQVASTFLVRLIGLFVPIMHETVEMMYQYNQPYVFDSSKVEQHFAMKSTAYEIGIRETIDAMKGTVATV